MNILFIGDIVGQPGRDAVISRLPGVRQDYAVDFVIGNGENVAGGFGLTSETARELFTCGIDVLTLGNHAWDKRDILNFIETDTRILRPANYPPGTPGKGHRVYEVQGKGRVAVLQLMGRVHMAAIDCPFRTADVLVEELRKETAVIFVDIHAEATSEKVAMGWYLDGRASAVIGSHTHVQTADERILPGGTAYQTDAGMTGPRDSVIGMKKELTLQRFLTQIKVPFEVAKGDPVFSATFVSVEDKAGRAVRVERILRAK